MARLFLAFLIALMLLPAPTGAAGMPARECAMLEPGPVVPEPHDSGCCTQDCVMTSAAAMLPAQQADPPEAAGVALAPWCIAPSALLSTNPAADDPPPR